MRKINTLVPLIFGIFLFLSCQTASAQSDTYTVLAPLPCIGGNCKESSPTTTLEKYIPGIFNLAIGISFAFVLLNLVFGGFQYMSSDAFTGKKEGIERIRNSIKGLLLVVGAWIILFTVNPNLVKINLSIETIKTPTVGGGAVTSGVALTTEQITASNSVRTSLQTEGVYTYAPPCDRGQTTGCVNLNGLKDSTKDSLVLLKKDFTTDGFGDTINITGGTEGGHSSTGGHPTGDSIDFSFSRNPNMTSYVEKNKVGNPTTTSEGFLLYTVNVNGKNVSFLKESNHWHVNFSR